jgi:hypothetical protein
MQGSEGCEVLEIERKAFEAHLGPCVEVLKQNILQYKPTQSTARADQLVGRHRRQRRTTSVTAGATSVAAADDDDDGDDDDDDDDDDGDGDDDDDDGDDDDGDGDEGDRAAPSLSSGEDDSRFCATSLEAIHRFHSTDSECTELDLSSTDSDVEDDSDDTADTLGSPQCGRKTVLVPRPPPPSFTSAEEEGRAVFRRVDSDGSGLLDLEELEVVRQPCIS